MVLSSKERSAIWRQKLSKKREIVLYEYKRKERERRKGMIGQNRKSIMDMSSREQGKKWKDDSTEKQINKRKRYNFKITRNTSNLPPLQYQEDVEIRADRMRRLGWKIK